tara:strand:- start:75 stop:416 length:342 start_codon:yes stop_codon:yes gene_type:complete
MGDDTFEFTPYLVENKELLVLTLEKLVKDKAIGELVINIQAKDNQLLRECPIDQVRNIASFQEINLYGIEAYFEDLRVILLSVSLFSAVVIVRKKCCLMVLSLNFLSILGKRR